jgi:outer membrane protein OmpA-like peptidoglycan-associated protein
MNKSRRLLLLSASIAWTSSLIANVVGTDLQNFNTTTNGIDFITVEASESLEVGILNFGFAMNYAVNSLPVFENESATQSRFNANDSLLTTESNFGLGLFKNFEMGVSFPEIIRQKVDANDVAHGSFNSIGLTSIRVGAKYRLWSNANYGVAIASSVNFNRIRNNPYLGTGNSPIYNAFLVMDTTVASWSLATNIGYRWRTPAEARPGSPISPTKNQLITSVAASYLLSSIDTKFIAEIFSSRPTERSGSSFLKRQSSSAEAILALKYDLTGQLATYGGGGTELINGASSPDWRVFAGVNWTVGPTFGARPELQKFEAGPPKAEEIITLSNVQFEFGSGNRVLPGALAMISKIAAHIKEPPEYKKIIVRGHTDSVGSDQFNLALSEKRAISVKETLVKTYGLDPKRIIAQGMGEAMPVADNGNFQGRQQNRRVEIIITR